MGAFLNPSFRSWGGLQARGSAGVCARAWADAPEGGRRLLAHGAGRSYGDSCLLDSGAMLDTGSLNRIESLDPASGVLVAEAGVTLARVIELVLPRGFFLPVTPGTRFVTLGGAIANDVHGKNHHAAGTFGEHVLWLELVRSNGERLRCSSSENADLFRATIAGMGLTGLITRLALRLAPVAGPFVRQDTIPFCRLDEFFALASESDHSHAYTVAWIDSLASGARLGRGVFLRANHDPEPGPFAGLSRPLPLMPFTPPLPLVNRLGMGLFNAAYRAAHRRRVDNARVAFEPFFYPLDKVAGWNRAYGPRGLRQHQCVVPMAVAREAVRDLLVATQRAGAASFLTVLKLFGERSPAGMLSFPMGGATLTLDFAYRSVATDRLLAELDRIAIQAGGRVNPYKDARMSGEVFDASFPQWREFAQHVDPAFTSNFWQRVSA